MPILVKSVVALLALTVPFTASYAKTIKISGTHTHAEIHAKCVAAGGLPYNTKGKTGKFGCDPGKKFTQINCNANGKCTGFVPQ